MRLIYYSAMPSIPGLLLLALLLGGCASTPSSLAEPAWIPDEDWWAAAMESGGTVVSRDGSARFVRALHARNLYETSRRIREQSAIAASIALVDSDDLNAFSAESGGRRIVTLTLALLEAIGDDRDALATTIGHEVAHLYYGHGGARSERNAPAQTIAYVLGTIAAGIPMSGTAGTIAVNTSFSRYEEREADLKGMEWAMSAGFSPCGSARTMRILRTRNGPSGESPWLSTHPGHEERIGRAIAMSQATSRSLADRLC